MKLFHLINWLQYCISWLKYQNRLKLQVCYYHWSLSGILPGVFGISHSFGRQARQPNIPLPHDPSSGAISNRHATTIPSHLSASYSFLFLSLICKHVLDLCSFKCVLARFSSAYESQEKNTPDLIRALDLPFSVYRSTTFPVFVLFDQLQ